jgi:hypothetical protein
LVENVSEDGVVVKNSGIIQTTIDRKTTENTFEGRRVSKGETTISTSFGNPKSHDPTLQNGPKGGIQ